MQQPITREQAKAMVSQKIAIIEKQVAINKACLGPLKYAHDKFSTPLSRTVSMANITEVVEAMAHALDSLCNNNILQLEAVSRNMEMELAAMQEQLKQLDNLVLPANLVQP